MKVLYVNHTSNMSGAELSLRTLLDALPPEVEARVACPAGPLADALRADAVPVTEITGTDGSLKLHPARTPLAVTEILRAALQVRRAAGRARVAVLHANSIRAGLVAVLARRLGAPPVLTHVRDVLPPGRASALALAAVRRGSSVVVANSAFTAARVGPMPAGASVRVAHNPVDLRRFDPARGGGEAVRAELGLSADAFVLGIVAQLTPWKGQDVAVEALARLRERGVEATLLLVGEAKFVARATRFDNVAYLRSLEALAARRGVGAHVRFLGQRDDVPEVMSALTVLLMPSWEEPFGRSAAEAMAMGVPVLATAAGGPSEILGDAGILLAPRDAAAWTDALADVLGDPDRREAMGRQGRARARVAFDARRHASEMVELYASLAEARSCRAPGELRP